MFDSPSISRYDLNFSYFGVPIRITPYFWILVAFLGASSRSAQGFLLWGVAVFIGVMVHEFGHALAMKRYGFSPEITLCGTGGLTTFNARLSNPNVFLTSWDNILISAAGPVAGFALWGALAVLLVTIGIDPIRFMFGTIGPDASFFVRVFEPLVLFIRMEMYICFWWGLLNLMPVYPLDGGQIAREFFYMREPQSSMTQTLQLSLVTATGLAVIAILYDQPWAGLFFGFFAFNSWQMMRR